jgi:UDP-GlcNAc:undecaprenyl-phosphate GlcNAc-1-phosphate transferase
MPQNFMISGVSGMLATFVVTVALVALTIRVCLRRRWMANPRADRWHKSAACLFGGVPLWLSTVMMALVFVPFSSGLVWKLIAASSTMFALGLADDIWHFRPRTKFAVQILVAGWIVHAGLVYPLVHSNLVNSTISLLWIVGITNAFNLLDNMDGLAAGIALISAIYLAAFFLGNSALQYTSLVLLVAGASAGFLLFNFNPARIFMGDSGSLSLGFLLGGSSLLQLTHVSGLPAFVLAPALVLAVPVFDTLFVSVTRRMRGQAVSQGGTDHCSHRLVRLGLSERGAVLLLYGLSIGSGAVALEARQVLYWRAMALAGIWGLFLFLFGIYLFRLETISGEAYHPSTSRMLGRLWGRDSLAVLLDPVALSLSYYLAYFLRFGQHVPDNAIHFFYYSWPLVVSAKLVLLAAFRIYKRSWWRGSMTDVYRLAQATLIGEAVSALFLIAFHGSWEFTAIVLSMDALFSWVFLAGIRKSFALFRDSLVSWSSPLSPDSRRVFLLGTSEHTDLALRFLRDRHIVCAGLIDTNGGADVGRWVWGSLVLGSIADLPRLKSDHGVHEVVLPQDESMPYSEREFCLLCEQAQLSIVRLGLFPANSVARN